MDFFQPYTNVKLFLAQGMYKTRQQAGIAVEEIDKLQAFSCFTEIGHLLYIKDRWFNEQFNKLVEYFWWVRGVKIYDRDLN